jgi:hypothetical protein
MKIFRKILTISTVGLTLLSTSAFAYPINFVGIWKNTNPNTRGIVRIVITPDLKMRMFGACTPTPCDNGQTQLITFGKTVTDLNHKAAMGFYDLTFKHVATAVKIINSHKLTFEHYNQFVDGSGRQNYWMSENFKKVIPIEDGIIENDTLE